MVDFYLMNLILATTAVVSAIVALSLFTYVFLTQPHFLFGNAETRRNNQIVLTGVNQPVIPLDDLGMMRMTEELRTVDKRDVFEITSEALETTATSESSAKTSSQPSTSTASLTEVKLNNDVEAPFQKIVVDPACGGSNPYSLCKQ